MKFAWENKWSVGNAIIDAEHRNLLEMAYNIEAMIGEGDISAISHELDQFEDWLCQHFGNEEEIARAIHFDFEQNGLEHQNFLAEFQRMRGELMSDSGGLPESTAKRYARFLDEWLVAHILEEDMQMKPMLQTRAYNFMPDRKAQSEASGATRTRDNRFE